MLIDVFSPLVFQRTLQGQISSAEADIAKLTKALENSKLAYQSLQKQYAEQLGMSTPHSFLVY